MDGNNTTETNIYIALLENNTLFQVQASTYAQKKTCHIS